MGVKIRNSDLHAFLLNILKALKQILFQSILTSNSRVMTFYTLCIKDPVFLNPQCLRRQ
jgi:hypothetical protein